MSSAEHDAVAFADCPCRCDYRVDASARVEPAARNVKAVVLGEGLEYLRVLVEVFLRHGRHHAPRVGHRHAELHVVTDVERVAEPRVLDEATCWGGDDHVHPESPHIERAPRLPPVEMIQG